MQTLTLVLASLGVFQAALLSLYLVFLRKGNRLANEFLALLLAGITLRIAKSILNNYWVLEPWQRNIGLSGILIVGPSLLFYLYVFKHKTPPSKFSLSIHYLPALLFMALSAYIPNNFDLAARVSYQLVFVHLFGYLLYCEWYRRKQFASSNNQEIRRWLANILIGVGIIWLYYALQYYRIVPSYIGGAITYSILIYAFSYLMLNASNFHQLKYANNTLSEDNSLNILNTVENLFAHQQVYLDQSLNINKVAEQLALPSRDISRVINQFKQLNFSEFVTVYRIQHAQQMLANDQFDTAKIATIAHDCGFGNVTSFNTAFKTKYHQTPSEYRKSLKSL
jgi:AraC-like DNA-binding protein